MHSVPSEISFQIGAVKHCGLIYDYIQKYHNIWFLHFFFLTLLMQEPF